MSEKNRDNTNITNCITNIEEKLDFFTKKTVISIIILCAISLSIRLYYFPYDLPFIRDALVTYFLYASDISVLGHLPNNFPIGNIGWSVLLSFFFTLFHPSTFMDFVVLQRSISIVFSVSTIIPVYFLCKRFFDKPYAIFGAAIFAFEPHIIQNSLLGITEPLYILLVTSGLALYFSSRDKLVLLSFVVISLSTIVRSEGLFVFFPLVIMFFIKNRKDRHVIRRVLVIITIFVLVLLPAYVIKIQTQGNDRIVSRVFDSTNQIITTSNQEGFTTYFIHATKNFIEFSGWSLVPIFIILLPIGVFLLLHNYNTDKVTIIFSIFSMLFPVYYAFSVAPDTRFIYPLFPLFCVASIFTIKNIVRKNSNHNVLLVILLGTILFASLVFLDIKKIDYEHQREAYNIALYITSIAKGINDYGPEDGYIMAAQIPQKWPVLSSSLSFHTMIIPINGSDSLEKYIESSRNNLTHLVIDDNKNTLPFLSDVSDHEEKYPYLIKVFDSSQHGYKYKVKIYKIDYKKF